MSLKDDVLLALRDVDPSAPSTAQLKPVEKVIGDALGFPHRTYAISVSAPGNLVKQADQSARARAADLLVVCLRSDEFVDAVERITPKLIGPGRLTAVAALVLGTDSPRIDMIVEPADATVHRRLVSQWPGAERRVVSPGFVDQSSEPAVAVVPGVTLPQTDEPPLILDPAVKRMLRLAIASYKAVMLVGPPGTGKTTLIEEAVREAALAPGLYGLSEPPRGLRIVTPEESWSARELLGGETVDDQGRLRFTPGHVLRAIAADEWLVLDEANRADMDRIFGALLTWLSGKPVTVGTASGASDAATVRLEWSTDPRSSTTGTAAIETGQGQDVVFRAGTDWRLLGTYNAVDAQRVFRLGQALGRRFVRVPVPPVDRAQFLQALRPRLEQLPAALDSTFLEQSVAGLYETHREQRPPLGPAVFLAIPVYVARGLMIEEPDANSELSEATGIDETAHVDAAADSDPAIEGPARAAARDGLAARAHQLLTEAYLLGAGTVLASLDDLELELVRARVVDREGLLSPSQWAFIRNLLPALE